MTKRARNQDSKVEATRYAGREDFYRIFSEDLKDLYQLSFLLTCDLELAERCLVCSLEDCVIGNPVFREWVRSWAKRTIIQNAIRELKPRPTLSNSPRSATFFPGSERRPNSSGGHFRMHAVLQLENFDRFVLVMSALENYSEHDCALLLGCSVPEIREARSRALKALADSPHMDHSQHHMFAQEKK
jgi:hypothetical protein